jgi:hypothetical protein
MRGASKSIKRSFKRSFEQCYRVVEKYSRSGISSRVLSTSSSSIICSCSNEQLMHTDFHSDIVFADWRVEIFMMTLSAYTKRLTEHKSRNKVKLKRDLSYLFINVH